MMSLPAIARSAAERAYAPYSGYKVGCAIESAAGNVYEGCNVENVSFGATLCAERVAVGKMVSSGDLEIARLAVYTRDGSPPCGICLQVLSEFAAEKTEVVLVSQTGGEIVKLFSELLPFGFESHAVKRTERS